MKMACCVLEMLKKKYPFPSSMGWSRGPRRVRGWNTGMPPSKESLLHAPKDFTSIRHTNCKYGEHNAYVHCLGHRKVCYDTWFLTNKFLITGWRSDKSVLLLHQTHQSLAIEKSQRDRLWTENWENLTLYSLGSYLLYNAIKILRQAWRFCHKNSLWDTSHIDLLLQGKEWPLG